MANDASIGRHTLQQIQRLERNLSRLSGEKFTMPDHNRHSKDFLFIDQLKAVNICLEEMLGSEADPEEESELVATEIPPNQEQPETEVEGEADPEEESTSDYQDMNVPQLKSLAKKRNLLSASLNTKVLLIEALEAADKAAEQAKA